MEGYLQAFHVRLDVVGGEDQFTWLTGHDKELDMDLNWFDGSCPMNVEIGERVPLVDTSNPKGMDRNCLPGDLRCPW